MPRQSGLSSSMASLGSWLLGPLSPSTWPLVFVSYTTSVLLSATHNGGFLTSYFYSDLNKDFRARRGTEWIPPEVRSWEHRSFCRPCVSSQLPQAFPGGTWPDSDPFPKPVGPRVLVLPPMEGPVGSPGPAGSLRGWWWGV